jgi:hypothetical protein
LSAYNNAIKYYPQNQKALTRILHICETKSLTNEAEEALRKLLAIYERRFDYSNKISESDSLIEYLSYQMRLIKLLLRSGPDKAKEALKLCEKCLDILNRKEYDDISVAELQKRFIIFKGLAFHRLGNVLPLILHNINS